jgi:superfamily II DNA helicase RecQ
MGWGFHRRIVFLMGFSFTYVCSFTISSVRYVFHAGQSYSMEDYHQETGRLSRDGRKGIAICVTSPDFVDQHMQNCSDISSRRQLTDWMI